MPRNREWDEYYQSNGCLRASISKDKIREYWLSTEARHFLHLEENSCFACGVVGAETDRAHILAKSENGSPFFNNLHILCKMCHGESEYHSSINYWAWIIMKSLLYHRGSMCPKFKHEDGRYRFSTEAFSTKYDLAKEDIMNYFMLKDYSKQTPTQLLEASLKEIKKLKKESELHFIPSLEMSMKFHWIYTIGQNNYEDLLPSIKWIEENDESIALFKKTYDKVIKNVMD